MFERVQARERGSFEVGGRLNPPSAIDEASRACGGGVHASAFVDGHDVVDRSQIAVVGDPDSDLKAIIGAQQAEIDDLREQLRRAGFPEEQQKKGQLPARPSAALTRRLTERLARVWGDRRLAFETLSAPFTRVFDFTVGRERIRALRRYCDWTQAPPTLRARLGLNNPYAWFRARSDLLFLDKPRVCIAGDGPLISVVLPVYKVSRRVLRATLDSLLAQTYPRWEACIACADPEGKANLRLLNAYAKRDPRIRLKVLDENFGIAGNSNAALDLATGDYVALLDHDDELPPAALARIVEAIAGSPGADLLYTDKELVSDDSSRRYDPLFKPAWSPEMLYSVNYITHLTVIRRDLVQAVGGWSMGVDGAQDWDLFLKATEQARCVVRVPGVAYSWRVHPQSTASSLDAKPYAQHAQLRALERHAHRTGLPGHFVHHDTNFKVIWDDVEPCAVVVLPSQTAKGSCAAVVRQLARQRDSFTSAYLVLARTEADQLLEEFKRLGETLPAWCDVVLADPHDARPALRSLLLQIEQSVTVFLDGDGQVLTPDALQQLSGWLYDGSAISFASGVAVYDGDIVVEAGCVTDQMGVTHSLFRGERLLHWGPFGGPLWRRNVDTASPYLLAMRTSEAARVLEELAGGLQEVFHEACARLTEDGVRRGVVEPTARVMLASGGGYPPALQGSVGDCGGFFHPELAISSAGKIVLSQGAPHVA
jgi:hypothetical protein